MKIYNSYSETKNIMRNILISGNGFLGSNLIELLSKNTKLHILVRKKNLKI